MPKFLITGGCGFIGSHLAHRLIAEGHHVRVLDIRKPEETLAGRIPYVEYQQGDIRLLSDVETAIKDRDAIFHFAAIVSVPYCQEHPEESYRTNFLGTLLILEAIKSKNIPLIFASSAAVYGHLGEKTKTLSEQTISEPISFYGHQKLASEQIIQIYHKNHSIQASVFRFFNVFGPGQDPSSPYSGAISIFIKNIRESLPIKIFGTGLQTRDFISVHDLVDAFMRCLQLKSMDPSPMNLGTGSATTIESLVQKLIQLSGKNVPIEICDSRSGDILHSCANTERVLARLNWKPTRSLDEGLKELMRQDLLQG